MNELACDWHATNFWKEIPMAEKLTKPQESSTAHSDESDKTTNGRGWHGDSEGHARAGRKGGTAISSNREHMAQIGSRGGKTVSSNKEHMARIGSKGGKARGAKHASAEQAKADEAKTK